MIGKTVIVSNETPNDQNCIIRNNSIKLDRFSKNPIMLIDHDWSKIAGHWENLRLENNEFKADAVFTNAPEMNYYKTLFEEGNLKCASIGGICKFKLDNYGKPILKDGNKISEEFNLYEISLVPIPSNPDATTLSAKFYDNEELLILSSKIENMAKKTKENEEVEQVENIEQTENENKTVNDQPEPTKPKGVKHVILHALDGFKDLINIALGSEPPTPKHTEPDGDEPVKVKEPEKTGKIKAEAEPDNDEMASKIEACNNESDLKAIEASYGSEMPDVIRKAIEKKQLSFTKNNSTFKKMDTIEIKEQTELSAKMAAPPVTQKIEMPKPQSLTELSAKTEGKELITKLSSGKPSDLAEYQTFLHALLEDPKYRAVIDKMRFVECSSDSQADRYRGTNNPTGQNDLRLLASNLSKDYMKLAGSDDLLNTPDLQKLSWLPLVMFKLFPTDSWRSKIPMFGVTETGSNLGLIWTNIAADPTIYQGAKPSPSDYEADDTPVSLKMVNYWMQPMIWTPLKNHVLPYDKMAAQWAQGITKFNYVVDKELIYTLLSLVPSTSFVKTKGSQFSIGASTDIDSFVLNPDFAGSVAAPQIADAVTMRQLFSKQNFPAKQSIEAVVDSTAFAYISRDADTKSLLTRWVEGSPEALRWGNVNWNERSEVGLYDPSTALIKDPFAAFSTGCTGANLFFIPDQVGIGIGKIDVFMIQDPTKYGYRMSMDTRYGIQPLRSDFKGIGAYIYGDPIV